MVSHRILRALLPAALGALAATPLGAQAADGWLSWRGPHQNGTSDETNLLEQVEPGGDTHLWSFEASGRGTPVIANGRVYAMSYSGKGADLQERLVCLDERDGSLLWEDRFNDFLSDTIYNRYAIGSPTVDADTGLVYCLTSPGLLRCYTADGHLVWSHSMIEEFGRITFPNGRTGSPLVVGDRVIIHVINAHWGREQGPARDRFYAFHKITGESLWGCTPGETPKDSSFSMPVVAQEHGRDVIYATTGCGHLVCIDLGTGAPLWRYQLSIGGANSAPLVYQDTVIAIHGKENPDTSTIGRMVRVRPPGSSPAADGPVVLGPGDEMWRADLVAFTSSPVLVGNRVYATVATGELVCVDADTGAVLWQEKLAADQIHASPLYADGKLYVPMNNGTFHILRPTDQGPKLLCQVQLEGNCLGAPAIQDGRIYVHTTERLYCFGRADAPTERPAVGPVTRLQVIPADVVLRQGERVPVYVRGLDAQGRQAAERVAATFPVMPRGTRVEHGHLVVPEDCPTGVGVLRAQVGELTGEGRVRIVARLPWSEDFDGVALDGQDAEGTAVGKVPSAWLGVNKKWDVREVDGSQVLAKTLDIPLFQRAMGFLGHPAQSDYTMQMDIMTDGNRRTMSSAGMVNQRYLIILDGNYQEIEISSNVERIKVSAPYRWKPRVWYTLKTRVDVAADGAGVIRAKVWPRDEAEPEAWNLEVPHANAHREGSPGLYGFAPQSRFRVYVDNLVVTPND